MIVVERGIVDGKRRRENNFSTPASTASRIKYLRESRLIRTASLAWVSHWATSLLDNGGDDPGSFPASDEPPRNWGCNSAGERLLQSPDGYVRTRTDARSTPGRRWPSKHALFLMAPPLSEPFLTRYNKVTKYFRVASSTRSKGTFIRRGPIS